MTSTEEWVERWIDVPQTWQFAPSSITLDFGAHGPTLTFSGRSLSAWQDGKLPSHPKLTFVPDCGIETVGYAEYLLDLEHIDQWPRNEPLRFRIGETLVELGAISPALALIFEPYYRSSFDIQSELYEQLSTLRVVGSSSPREDAVQALFYLNADYLAPSKASVRILHLQGPIDIADVPDFDAKSPGRKRIRTRSPIGALVPVRLFLAAVPDYGESRFLSFYRVLEFYFTRARLSELSVARRDTSVSDTELFKRVREERGELPQLKAVLRSALTVAEARALARYLNHHKLATCKSVDDVSVALYSFRNGIVHAKEEDVARSRVPDPFAPASDSHRWEWVAQYLAIRCIRRL